MPSADDPRLLAPFKVSGKAVDHERNVRDDNNAPKTDEQIWLAAAAEQNEEISTLEEKYLDELRRRAKK
jgi:hypothetical protein